MGCRSRRSVVAMGRSHRSCGRTRSLAVGSGSSGLERCLVPTHSPRQLMVEKRPGQAPTWADHPRMYSAQTGQPPAGDLRPGVRRGTGNRQVLAQHKEHWAFLEEQIVQSRLGIRMSFRWMMGESPILPVVFFAVVCEHRSRTRTIYLMTLIKHIPPSAGQQKKGSSCCPRRRTLDDVENTGIAAAQGRHARSGKRTWRDGCRTPSDTIWTTQRRYACPLRGDVMNYPWKRSGRAFVPTVSSFSFLIVSKSRRAPNL